MRKVLLLSGIIQMEKTCTLDTTNELSFSLCRATTYQERALRTAALLLLTVSPLSAQTISDEPMCTNCVITMRHAATLNSSGGEDGTLSSMPRITTDGTFYFATPTGLQEGVKVFDQDGRYVRTIADREGEGPGEFQRVLRTIPSQGDLLVFDYGNARISVLDAEGTYRTSWQIELLGLGGVARLDNGGLAINAMLRDPVNAGKAVQLYAPNTGKPYAIVDEFSFTPKTNGRFARVLVAVDGGFLSIRQSEEYLIRAYTNSGLLAGTYSRDAPWFDSPITFRKTTRDVPPVSRVVGAYVVASLLYVYIVHRDEEWAEALGAERPVGEYGAENGATAYEVADIDALYDTFVEVINLDEGELVARSRFDRHLIPVAPCIAAAARADHLGFYETDIYNIELERGDP